MNEQFDVVINKVLPGTAKKLLRDDLQGRRRSLDQRWQLVQEEIRLRENLGQLDKA